jgi:hypothetical protein
MIDLPSNIRFDALGSPGVLKVSYVQPPATPRDEAAVLQDPLDLWGVSWILNNDMPQRVVDVRPPRGLSRAQLRTLAMRLVVLQDSMTGFEFRLDGSARYVQEAAEIRGDIKSGLLFTYDRANLHRGAAGTKPAPEAAIETWVGEHAKKFLQGAFPHRLVRQFPAGVFKTSLAERNRATSKLWIDMVGVDKEGRLSAIELKIGEELSLDRFGKGIDGAVFCHLFQKYMQRSWFPDVTSDRIALYLLAEKFHPALVGADGDPCHPLTQVIQASDWLDVILVQIDASNLPHGLAERVLFPAPAPLPVE